MGQKLNTVKLSKVPYTAHCNSRGVQHGEGTIFEVGSRADESEATVWLVRQRGFRRRILRLPDLLMFIADSLVEVRSSTRGEMKPHDLVLRSEGEHVCPRASALRRIGRLFYVI